MTETTLYRRPLPENAIPFASAEGRRVFAEALAAGGLTGYFPLAEQFHTQSDPAFCGLGSLVVSLNAMGIDPGRLWKGPWRWFAEDLLDCCVPLTTVRERGLDLDELGCLARCNGAQVEVVHADATGFGAFQQAMREAADGRAVMVAAYDRAALGQTGAGHFSPIAGHHAARDLVLILDVARFKYPPHWVSAELLYAAMLPVDPASGRARGWLSLRPRGGGVALGFSIRCTGSTWREIGQRLRAMRSELAAAHTLEQLARAVLPLSADVELRTPSTEAHRSALAQTRATLRELAAYPRIAESIGAERAELVTLLLLSCAEQLPPGLRADFEALPHASQSLAAELDNLRAQLEALRAAPTG
jgi:glutathione gamma-glutamylcysteinyltransferase